MLDSFQVIIDISRVRESLEARRESQQDGNTTQK